MKNKPLSIVIPFYNEKGNIINLLNDFNRFINDYRFELILVNDWSKDWTKELFDELNSSWTYKDFVKFVTYDKNRWYWWAILTWLDESNWELVWWMHSDMQTDIKHIFEAYDLYLESGENKKLLIKWHRKNREISQIVFSYMMSIICSVVFFMKLVEINAQPKLFPRDLYNKFDNPPTDFSLDLYLLVLAKKNKYNIESIKVNYIDRVYWESKWSYSFKSKVKTILRTLKYIFKLRLWKK